MGWIAEDHRHELDFAAVFADGSLGSAQTPTGVLISHSPDGRPVSDSASERQTRPQEEVTGWVLCCVHYLDSESVATMERLAEWKRVDAPGEDWPEQGLPYSEVGSEMLVETRADLDDLLAGIWHSHLYPMDPHEVISAAAERVEHATLTLDEAVRCGRTAGLTWAEIGRATGITRQSAHERWGGR